MHNYRHVIDQGALKENFGDSEKSDKNVSGSLLDFQKELNQPEIREKRKTQSQVGLQHSLPDHGLVFRGDRINEESRLDRPLIGVGQSEGISDHLDVISQNIDDLLLGLRYLQLQGMRIQPVLEHYLVGLMRTAKGLFQHRIEGQVLPSDFEGVDSQQVPKEVPALPKVLHELDRLRNHLDFHGGKTGVHFFCKRSLILIVQNLAIESVGMVDDHGLLDFLDIDFQIESVPHEIQTSDQFLPELGGVLVEFLKELFHSHVEPFEIAVVSEKHYGESQGLVSLEKLLQKDSHRQQFIGILVAKGQEEVSVVAFLSAIEHPEIVGSFPASMFKGLFLQGDSELLEFGLEEVEILEKELLLVLLIEREIEVLDEVGEGVLGRLNDIWLEDRLFEGRKSACSLGVGVDGPNEDADGNEVEENEEESDVAGPSPEEGGSACCVH